MCEWETEGGVTPANLCAQLMDPAEAARRDGLLAAAAARPECLAFALDQARALTSATPDQALRFAGVAAEIARLRTEPRQTGAALRIRGQALRVLGLHEEAVRSFAEAAECAARAGDPALAAQFQIGSIDSLGMLGRYDEAIRLAQRLEEELRGCGEELHAARALCNEGSLHFRRDRLAQALDCYERAAEILARGGDDLMSAAVAVNRANVLTQLGRLDEAMALYRRAGTVYSARGLGAEVAVVETNLGYLEHVSGRPAAALGHYSRALDAFRAAGRDQDLARCEADMAESYRVLNLYPESLECCDRALRALDRLSLPYDRARVHLARAAALLGLGRLADAGSSLDDAERVFRRQRNGVQCAHVNLVRASLLCAMGRSDEAMPPARAAAAAFARAGLRGWAAEARFLLAEAELERVATVRAMLAVARAARQNGRGWLECRAEAALGRHYRRGGKRAAALRHLRIAVEVLERARTQIAPEGMHTAFLRDKQEVYGELMGVLLERGRPADVREAFELAERSRSRLLLERLQQALEDPRGPEALTGLDERVRRLRAELSRIQHLAQCGGEGETRRDLGPLPTTERIVNAEQSYEAALKELELRSAGRALRLGAPVTIDALQSCLQAGEVLLEYVCVDQEVCAFILTQTGLHAQVGLCPIGEVEGQARRLRYHLQKVEIAPMLPEGVRRRLGGEARSVLGKLYDLLLRPLETHLAGCGSLVVVPHGVLHCLPFHAFWDGAVYALDRWELLYGPSAAVWHHGMRRERGGSAPALLMAVPARGLPEVAAEVENIRRCLGGSPTHLSDAQSLETFRRLAPDAGMIHVASHARFRPDNPLFSGIRFADGWLLARDLYDLRLRCDLATLSACETGAVRVEPGDELFGLVRGFLAAGARSVAASLWPVHDRAAAVLMERFYAAVAAGRGKAAALRAAQQQTREEFPHPYYWAPFVMIGGR